MAGAECILSLCCDLSVWLLLRAGGQGALFDSVETVLAVLEVTAEFAGEHLLQRAQDRESLPAGHLDATTLADYLV